MNMPNTSCQGHDGGDHLQSSPQDWIYYMTLVTHTNDKEQLVFHLLRIMTIILANSVHVANRLAPAKMTLLSFYIQDLLNVHALL